jgi:hypothetical protein
MTFAAKGPPPLVEGGPLEELSSYGGIDLQASIPNEAPAQDKLRARLRRQRLVEFLHRLGPSPLGHFIREVEVETGADVTARLECYAKIDPEFVRALGGDRFAPSLHCIGGGGP